MLLYRSTVSKMFCSSRLRMRLILLPGRWQNPFPSLPAGSSAAGWYTVWLQTPQLDDKVNQLTCLFVAHLQCNFTEQTYNILTLSLCLLCHLYHLSSSCPSSFLSDTPQGADVSQRRTWRGRPLRFIQVQLRLLVLPEPACAETLSIPDRTALAAPLRPLLAESVDIFQWAVTLGQ